jgi:hypothetical protein
LRLKLLGLALAISIAIVVAGNLATDLVLADPVFSDGVLGSIDALDVAILHVLITSLPMVVLALRRVEARSLWIAAVLLTTAFWIYFNWQIWQDSLTGFEGGANIGLGLIMLASPFIVTIGVGLLALVLRLSGRQAADR